MTESIHNWEEDSPRESMDHLVHMAFAPNPFELAHQQRVAFENWMAREADNRNNRPEVM